MRKGENSTNTGAKKRALPKNAEPFKWQPGQSGNPGGRPKKKPWQEELERQLAQRPQDLAAIVRAAIRKAKKAEPRFAFELRDMLDGKPIQQIAGPDGGPIPVNLEGAKEALASLLEEVKNQRKESL